LLLCTLKLQREESVTYVLVDRLDDLTLLLCTFRDGTGNIDTRRGAGIEPSEGLRSGSEMNLVI
jgi:hypothetical protein